MIAGMESIGELLAAYLKRHQLKANQLALLSGVKRQRIHSYLREGEIPNEKNLKKLLKVMTELTPRDIEQFWRVQAQGKAEATGKRHDFGKFQKVSADKRKLREMYQVKLWFAAVNGTIAAAQPLHQVSDQASPAGNEVELLKVRDNSRIQLQKRYKKASRMQKGEKYLEGDCFVSLRARPALDLPTIHWHLSGFIDPKELGHSFARKQKIVFEESWKSHWKSRRGKGIRVSLLNEEGTEEKYREVLKKICQNSEVSMGSIFAFIATELQSALHMKEWGRREEFTVSLNTIELTDLTNVLARTQSFFATSSKEKSAQHADEASYLALKTKMMAQMLTTAVVRQDIELAILRLSLSYFLQAQTMIFSA